MNTSKNLLEAIRTGINNHEEAKTKGNSLSVDYHVFHSVHSFIIGAMIESIEGENSVSDQFILSFMEKVAKFSW